MGTVSIHALAVLAFFSSGSLQEVEFDPNWFITYVINGKNADIKKYPFSVGLMYNDMFTCGGSIINENWILTAAHCLFEPSGDSRDASSFTAVTGSSDIDQGTLTAVSDAVIHPNFRYTSSFSDDIAILQLSSPLSFDTKTQPALLPVPLKDVAAGTDATLLGWGYTTISGNPAHQLKEVGLVIYDQDKCSSLYSAIGKKIKGGEVCAMAPGGGAGQCTGDSGGPLVTSTPKGLLQVGVVSFSQKPCANAQYPGVFTKVSHYIDFIRSYTGP